MSTGSTAGFIAYHCYTAGSVSSAGGIPLARAQTQEGFGMTRMQAQNASAPPRYKPTVAQDMEANPFISRNL